MRPSSAKSGSPFAGIKTRIEAVKNHMSQPFKFAEIGIDHKGFFVDRDVEYMPEESESDEGLS